MKTHTFKFPDGSEITHQVILVKLLNPDGKTVYIEKYISQPSILFIGSTKL